MSEELIIRSREGITQSAFFLVFGTRNYANSIRDPREEDHHLIISQIEYAKSLEKPAILFLQRSLSAEDEQTIRDALEGMGIIGVFRFEAGNETSMKSTAIEMKKALDIRGEKVKETEADDRVSV